MHKHIEEQASGAKIRSRAKWVEEGEKSSKYFYNPERKNYSNNNIKQLKKENGSHTTNNKEILNEQYKFYNKLYEKDSISEESIKNYLNPIENLNILNEEEMCTLEGEISEKECEIAIKSIKLNKSPGSDGIPVEFYITFWSEIKSLVIDSMNSAYQNGELSITQKRGILNLIFKKSDKNLLSNWRPIALLNTDYKVLAHILANRLKKVIPRLIHTDQSGYIKGRNICFNIRLIQDVIDYFEESDQECAIVFLDFQKAFDTVNYDFLFSVLSKFNFGESFRRWVNITYTNAKSCVTNNGWTSKPFPVEKSIRQGCPLSALLFLLVVEVLATKLRKNVEWGLKIKENEQNKVIQISQLADDTTLFFTNEEAIINGLKLVDDFGNVSGLKLNKEKTDGLWLCRVGNRKDNLANINWDKSNIKALGVHFGYDKKEVKRKNWEGKIASIKTCLRYWNTRDLSLQGRIQIIKTLALAKVVYLTASINTPNWAIKEINKEFFTFLWKYKRDNMSRKVMVNYITNGGINMVDFKIFCISMKAVWAGRLLNCKEETWGIIPKKYFEQIGIEKILCMNAENERHILTKISEFYKEVVESWYLSGGGAKAPKSANDIRAQFLWGNRYIQTKEKRYISKPGKKAI